MASSLEHFAPAEARTVSLDEAARALGIGLTTAYNLARAGTFPARVFKVGATWRVSTKSLGRAIDGDDDHGEPSAAQQT